MSIAKDDFKLFDVVTEINYRIIGGWPVWWDVEYVCNLVRPSSVKIYLTPFEEDEDAVNVDFMRWVKSMIEGKTHGWEPPCFVSFNMKKYLDRTRRMVSSYGGKHSEDKANEGPYLFDFEGPFITNDFLTGFTAVAAYDAGLPYDMWKKFWRRHSKKIKNHMKLYVDVSTIGNWRW